MNKKWERTIELIGESNFNKISKTNILICGLGGVGGYVAEMIARLGVENIFLIDFDIVNENNFNRQIIAINDNIGKLKTECFKNRIREINDNTKTVCINDKIDELFFNKYGKNFDNIDFIFDCIDDKIGKLAIYKFAKEKNIKIISSMGTGRNINMNFKIDDMSKTKNCPLAKVMRKLCIDNNIENIPCVYNDIQSDIEYKGTLPTLPSTAGILMVQYFINNIIKEG